MPDTAPLPYAHHGWAIRNGLPLDAPTGPIKVSRIRIDRQGYGDDGRYYGTGRPVFAVSAPGWPGDYGYRADDYQHARELAKRYGVKVDR